MFHTMRLQMRIPGADSIEFMIRKKQLFQRHGFIPDVSILTLPFLIAMLSKGEVNRIKGIAPVWDHPRMHGEHKKILELIVCSVGSSPHARGTPEYRLYYTPNQGIIPACTGNTLRKHCNKAVSL